MSLVPFIFRKANTTDLVATLNNALASLLTSVVSNFQVGLVTTESTSPFWSPLLFVSFSANSSKGGTLTQPFQAIVFSAASDDSLDTLIKQYVAANPTYFIAGPFPFYRTLVPDPNLFSNAILIINTQGSVAAVNWGATPTTAVTFSNRSPVGWHSLAAFLQSRTSPAFNGITTQLVHTVEAPVLACRVILLNNEASTPTINNVNVSVSDTISDPNFNPTNGTWVPVTFSGSASVTLPARLGTNRPSRTVSDWINIQSIPPVDGSTFPYIFWRAYYATGPASGYGGTASNFMGMGSGSLAARGALVWPSLTDPRTAGRKILTSSQTGNFTSSAFTAPDSVINGVQAMEFEYIYASDVLTVCTLGDSIDEGYGASIPALSPIHYAAKLLSTQTRPVIPCNEGYSGQTTTNFVGRLGDMIASGRKPHIVVYSVFSPNDCPTTISAAQISTMIFNFAQARAACEQNGIVFVAATGIPGNWAAQYDSLRVGLNNYLRSLVATGLILCDYDLYLSNNATPAVIQFPLYTEASGNLHPYDNGYLEMGMVLANTLAPLIGQY